MVTMLVSYGASLIYFLREHFQALVLQYWEAVVAYITAAMILGLGFTRVVRGNEGSKHLLVVGVKWLIRIAATIVMYDAFSSSFMSLMAMGCIMAMYIVYLLTKWVITPSITKTKAKAKTK
jgi:hypothetical protein